MTVDLLPPPGEFRTTEEIRDANFAAELRRKRRRLLLWSLPVMVIAFLAAAKLLSAVAFNMTGSAAYGSANYNTAADRFSSLEFFNVVEPWKAHFNKGTAIYAGGEFFAATGPLGVALDLVPKSPDGEPRGEEECAVRTNYSLALEGLGDENLAAGNPAMALDYYDQAQDMLADCGEAGGSGGEEAQEAEERQQESQQDAQEQQEQQEQENDGQGDGQDGEDGEDGQETPTDGGDGQDGQETPTDGEATDDPTDDGTGGESMDPQQEELESRNREARESADAEEQASGGGSGGSGQNW